MSIARSDLAAIISESLSNRAETTYGDTVVTLTDRGDRVVVEFEGGTVDEFDLVIGADGLHSRVRELAFGPEPDFEHFGLSI